MCCLVLNCTFLNCTITRHMVAWKRPKSLVWREILTRPIHLSYCAPVCDSVSSVAFSFSCQVNGVEVAGFNQDQAAALLKQPLQQVNIVVSRERTSETLIWATTISSHLHTHTHTHTHSHVALFINLHSLCSLWCQSLVQTHPVIRTVLLVHSWSLPLRWYIMYYDAVCI